MKKQSLSKYCISLVVLIILAGVFSIMSSCGGGGGGGGPAPTSLLTTASPAAGVYGSVQSVTLTANRPATIYYSLNGNMPSIGGSDTISGPSPITNIQISSDTNLLQFFAVDSSGNQEAIKSETYVVNTGVATGPGDTQNYFPLAQGNTWGTQVTVSETGYPTRFYSDTYAITGTKLIDGATAVIYRESNPSNSGIPREDYNLKSSYGVLLLGYNDQSDKITSQLVPYQINSFRLPPGSSFVAINKTGLDYGEDIDYDGKNETADMNAVVTMKGFESVTVPDGTYSNCAKIEANVTVTVTISSDNEKISVTSIQTQWFAPGVGPVKSIIVTTGDNYSSTETEELVGYIIDGNAHGILKEQQTIGATNITDSSAYVTGIYSSPVGIFPTTLFEYGPTTSYGYTTTPVMHGTETGTATSNITGLQQLTTYHYRMVTSYAGFTMYGNDMTFKTLIMPYVVASGLVNPTSLVLDAANVYFTESTAVKKVAKNGGSVATLASEINITWALAVDATSVYWGEYYGFVIKKVGLNGGSVTTLASDQGNIETIALDASNVYWSQAGTINKVGKDGGIVTTIAGEGAYDLAVDSNYVYYSSVYERLKRVALSDGTITDLAGTAYSRHIAIDATNVYYSDGGLIKKFNKNDGSVTTLTSEANGIYNIAVDSTDVFWIEFSGGSGSSNLKRVGINGGNVTTLSSGLSSSNFYGLGVDDTYVYWTEESLGSTGGVIKRVPKSY